MPSFSKCARCGLRFYPEFVKILDGEQVCMTCADPEEALSPDEDYQDRQLWRRNPGSDEERRRLERAARLGDPRARLAVAREAQRGAPVEGGGSLYRIMKNTPSAPVVGEPVAEVVIPHDVIATDGTVFSSMNVLRLVRDAVGWEHLADVPPIFTIQPTTKGEVLIYDVNYHRWGYLVPVHRNPSSDEERRRLERAARLGDPMAKARLAREISRGAPLDRRSAANVYRIMKFTHRSPDRGEPVGEVMISVGGDNWSMEAMRRIRDVIGWDEERPPSTFTAKAGGGFSLYDIEGRLWGTVEPVTSRNPDDDLQRLRRQAALGDPMAIQRLARAEGRVETGFTWTPAQIKIDVRSRGKTGRRSYKKDTIHAEVAGNWAVHPSPTEKIMHEIPGYSITNVGNGLAIGQFLPYDEAKAIVERYLLPTGLPFAAKKKGDELKWSADEQLAAMKAGLASIKNRHDRARQQASYAAHLVSQFPERWPRGQHGGVIRELDEVPWPLGLDGEMY